MDGREALATIKSNQHLKRIPVVILTTSKLEEDLIRGYDLGAASYITKPVTFEGLVDMMKTLGRYWIEIVELPPGTPNA
jgi:two-component system response regulator